MNDMLIDQLQIRLRKWLIRKTISSAVRRVGELPLTIGSDIGTTRGENQDRVAVLKMQVGPSQSFLVAALCDGMGGMAEGSTCAAQAIASFFASCCSFCGIALSERMVRAAHEANRTVHSLYHGKGGATLSAILFDSKGGMAGINVGDSRIYLYQGSVLEQVTVDDTMAGLLPQLEDNIHPRNELLQFIGIGEGLVPHVVKITTPQELIVLTSDGVHFLDKNILQMVIRSANELPIAAKRIIEIAKWCGGRDNASIVIAAPTGNQSQKVEDSEVIHVWDPFGELQIVISGVTHNGMINNEPIKNPLPIIEKQKPQKIQTARQRDKVKFNKRKNSVDDASQEKNGETEKLQPQLKISFDQEPAEEHHG